MATGTFFAPNAATKKANLNDGGCAGDSYSETIGSYGNGWFNYFYISLGSLSAGYHTLGIQVTTFDYTTPYDYWVMSATIDDPPTATPAGMAGAPTGMTVCPNPATMSATALAQSETTVNGRTTFVEPQGCANPIANGLPNGTLIQTTP